MLGCNRFNNFFAVISSILIALAFLAFLSFCFCFLLWLFGLEYCTLKSLEPFFFKFHKVDVNISQSGLENGDFANLLLKELNSLLSLFLMSPSRELSFDVIGLAFSLLLVIPTSSLGTKVKLLSKTAPAAAGFCLFIIESICFSIYHQFAASTGKAIFQSHEIVLQNVWNFYSNCTLHCKIQEEKNS